MGHLKRVVLATVGGALLVTGIALLVLPGPGLLLVLAGMVLLAKAVPALRRHVEPVRARAMKAAEDSVSSWWRIAGSVIVGLSLLTAGVVAGVFPELPFAGWPTGISLMVSGLILFALLVWSHRRVRAAAALGVEGTAGAAGTGGVTAFADGGPAAESAGGPSAPASVSATARARPGA
ncbi:MULTISPECIES: PGPGW domain-containing protein [Streptomyces]|uniref:PGPGW domain-containing protein n=1 Tax=Streptomyces TaxID=1883 RepID=UPI002248B2DC|nr:PGPGW domain-containing protein [Streptomyces sp. JHD 1]MCX2969249.1 hypothetical protein [Streptomyces sp. JHD 1]